MTKHKPPYIHCAEPVAVRGEAPDGVIWQGRQWAVTAFGMEKRDGTYPVPARNLTMHDSKEGYDWIRHMATKGWVDLPDFVAAYAVARLFHCP